MKKLLSLAPTFAIAVLGTSLVLQMWSAAEMLASCEKRTETWRELVGQHALTVKESINGLKKCSVGLEMCHDVLVIHQSVLKLNDIDAVEFLEKTLPPVGDDGPVGDSVVGGIGGIVIKTVDYLR